MFFNQKGFSLLEVLIAVTILGFMSISITTFTDSTIDASLQISAEDIESLQIETAMSRLEWDISQSYSPLYFEQQMDPQQMTPEEGEIYNQLADYYQNNNQFNLLSFSGLPAPIVRTPKKGSFVFFTASNRRKIKNAKQSNFSWVKYEILPDNLSDEEKEIIGVPTQMLVRRVFANDVYTPDQIDWDEVKPQVLLHKILDIKFEFWDYQKEKWNQNLDVIQLGINVIRGVRLTVKYLDPTNEELTSVRIFRPLFPYFDPEDMYKFLKAQKKGANTASGGNAGGNNQ